MIGRTEYRLISICKPTEFWFGSGNDSEIHHSTIDFAGSNPELAEVMDGWEVISHQMVPAGEVTFLTLMLRTTAGVPDNLAGLDKTE